MSTTTDDVPDRPLVAFGLNDAANVLRRPHFREAARLAEDRLAALLTQARFFDGAPFSWVLVSAGLYKESQAPRLGRFDKTYGDLDISIAIDGIAYKRSTAEAVAEVFVRDSLVALLRAADRHDRPRDVISVELARMTKGAEVRMPRTRLCQKANCTSALRLRTTASAIRRNCRSFTRSPMRSTTPFVSTTVGPWKERRSGEAPS